MPVEIENFLDVLQEVHCRQPSEVICSDVARLLALRRCLCAPSDRRQTRAASILAGFHGRFRQRLGFGHGQLGPRISEGHDQVDLERLSRQSHRFPALLQSLRPLANPVRSVGTV